jgi:hypothetical protein
VSLDGFLIVISLVLVPFSVVSTFLLVSEARKPPRIGALSERAVIAVVITNMIVSGTFLTINRVTGYALIPLDVARVLFLASLILLEFVPVVWLTLLYTHRLGDGQ